MGIEEFEPDRYFWNQRVNGIDFIKGMIESLIVFIFCMMLVKTLCKISILKQCKNVHTGSKQKQDNLWYWQAWSTFLQKDAHTSQLRNTQ